MAIEQAPVAAPALEAAAVVAADNQIAAPVNRAAELASLIDSMTVPATNPDNGGVAEGENAVEVTTTEGEDTGANDLDSSLEAELGENGGEVETDGGETGGIEGDGSETELGDEGKAAKNFRGRWDHLNAQERRVVELTTKRGLSLEEAYRAVYGTPQPGAQQAAAVVDPVAAVDAEIGAAQAAVATLRQRLDNPETLSTFAFDGAEAIKFFDSLSEAQAKLTLLTSQKDQLLQGKETQARTQTQTAQEQANTQAFAAYPEAFRTAPNGQQEFNTETELGQAALDEYSYLEGIGSPLLKRPNCLPLIMARLARDFGVKPTKAQGTPPAALAAPSKTAPKSAPAAAAAPRRGARPVAAGGSAPVNPSADQLMQAAIASGSKDALLEAMRQFGTQFGA